MNETSQELATRDPVRDLVSLVRGDQFRQEVSLALPPDVTPERFVRITVTALQANPDIVRLERQSVYRALLQSAAMGLMPDSREAALVPFKGKAQLIPMIGGLRKIAADYGWALRARVVFANDEFEYEEGAEPKLLHRPARPGMERGERVAVYATARHKDGRRLDPVVLYAAEVEKIRKTSAKPDSGPWKDWTERMWEKTAARQLFKALPLDEKDRERVDRVIEATEPGEAATLLYGPAVERQALTAATGDKVSGADGPESEAASTGRRADSEAPAASADFDEPEPGDAEEGFKPPASAGAENDPDVLAANEAAEFVIPIGTHKGKTLRQKFDEGEKGIDWIRWCLRNYKTDPLMSHAWAFARVYLPDIYQEVKASQEASS